MPNDKIKYRPNIPATVIDRYITTGNVQNLDDKSEEMLKTRLERNELRDFIVRNIQIYKKYSLRDWD